MRVLGILILLITASFVALWQLGIINIEFANTTTTQNSNRTNDRASRNLFQIVQTGSLQEVVESIDKGAKANSVDREGKTPLMYAAEQNPEPVIVAYLLQQEGVDINATSDLGRTALSYAAEQNPNSDVLLTLMNAGADPSIRDLENKTAFDHGGMNVDVRRSRVYRRLEEFQDKSFDPRWPSGYTNPIQGATFTSRRPHLPNQARAYRNGVHEGFDFFDGVVTVPIEYGTEALAIGSGKIIRADHEYVEFTVESFNRIIEDAKRSSTTPESSLDRLRGRQVWIQHVGGYVSRYAHLDSIPASIKVGSFVRPGQVVGYIGNSGTIEAAENTPSLPHLHFEFWDADGFMGEGKTSSEIYDLIAQVFGEQVRPGIISN